MREAISRQLETARRAQGPEGRARHAVEQSEEAAALALEGKHRKLLELYYADKISADLFAAEEDRLRALIDLETTVERRKQAETEAATDLVRRFNEVAALLAELDLSVAWDAATMEERRVLVDELLDEVALFPDHLEVVVAGAPRLNILLEEVDVQSFWCPRIDLTRWHGSRLAPDVVDGFSSRSVDPG